MLLILVAMLLGTLIVLRKLDITEKRVDNEGTHKFNKNTCTIFDDSKKDKA